VNEGDFSEKSGVAALEKLGVHAPAKFGLFAANDEMAYGALITLQSAGVSLPLHVSLVELTIRKSCGC